MLHDGLSPLLVWGLMPRFIGVLYILAFGALIPQHDWMPGSSKLLPLKLQLARIGRDYPGLEKFFRLPTLLWLNASDSTVRGIPFVGVLCGIGAVYGGPLSWPATGRAPAVTVRRKRRGRRSRAPVRNL